MTYLADDVTGSSSELLSSVLLRYSLDTVVFLPFRLGVVLPGLADALGGVLPRAGDLPARDGVREEGVLGPVTSGLGLLVFGSLRLGVLLLGRPLGDRPAGLLPTEPGDDT